MTKLFLSDYEDQVDGAGDEDGGVNPAKRLLLALIVAASCFAGFLLMTWSTVAHAQSVPGSIALNWTLPTTGCTVNISPCDNKPLTGNAALTAVEVYISTSPIADSSTMSPTLTLAAGATTASHTLTVTNGATLYARVKVVNAAAKSAFTTQVSRLVELGVVPGVATSVTITLTINPQ